MGTATFIKALRRVSGMTNLPSNQEQFMKVAIEKARKGIFLGQTPFGACIVKAGKVVSSAHNEVWQRLDSTAHAEIIAIREACRRLKTIDLSGCVIYSTCEPCPMCFSACHWAKLSAIVYGAGIEDAQAAGFSELTLSDEEMKRRGKSPLSIRGGVLREDCISLFTEWKQRPDSKAY